MPTEEYRDGEAPDREVATGEYSFDELSKGLANGTISRGRALKLVGAALLGGALSIFSLGGVAEARRRARCLPCGNNPIEPGELPPCPEGTECCIISEGTGCCVPEGFCQAVPT